MVKRRCAERSSFSSIGGSSSAIRGIGNPAMAACKASPPEEKA